MKKRISRVTTRSGDTGESGLADGSRLPKGDDRFEAIGDVDELNSFIGVFMTHVADEASLMTLCVAVQQDLFDIGGRLATLGQTPAPSLTHLESEAEKLNKQLPPLTEFVLPSGTPAAAAAHVCRAVCRRAERSLWRLNSKDAIDCARYLNRLSDVFFIVARVCNAGHTEAEWRGSKKPD